MKYFKLHQKYILNKINIIIILSLIILSILISLISIKNLSAKDLYFNKYNASYNYLENNMLLFKLIILSVFCFVWGNSFTKENESYHILVNDYNKHKIKYYLTKIGILFIVSFILIYLIFIFSSIFGIKFTFFYENSKFTISLFLSYLLIILIYGNIAIIFTIFIENSFASFISVALFVFGEIIGSNVDNEIYLNIYYLIFPTLNLSYSLISRYGVIHLLLLCMIYFFLSFVSYINFKKN